MDGTRSSPIPIPKSQSRDTLFIPAVPSGSSGSGASLTDAMPKIGSTPTECQLKTRWSSDEIKTKPKEHIATLEALQKQVREVYTTVSAAVVELAPRSYFSFSAFTTYIDEHESLRMLYDRVFLEILIYLGSIHVKHAEKAETAAIMKLNDLSSILQTNRKTLTTIDVDAYITTMLTTDKAAVNHDVMKYNEYYIQRRAFHAMLTNYLVMVSAINTAMTKLDELEICKGSHRERRQEYM